jgi:hypothetical protein
MAPRPDGTLYVAIPRPRGAVIELLDASGEPRFGWPLALPYSTACSFLAKAADGSVRTICDAVDVPQPALGAPIRRAYAFSADGTPLAGWPVEGPFSGPARVDRDRLVALSTSTTSDTVGPGPHPPTVWVTTVDADGTVRDGVRVSLAGPRVTGWAIGPGGVAYGTRPAVGSGSPGGEADPGAMMAIDAGGLRPGWPVALAGSPSIPASLPDGRVVVTIGFPDRDASRVLLFDAAGAVAGGSPELPITSASVGGCAAASVPDPPLVADDGTVFVTTVYDDLIYGLDASLRVIPGWPLTPPRDLLALEPAPCPPGGLCCDWPAASARPAPGTAGTLYLPLQPGSPGKGAGLVAIGRQAQPLTGWPVELRRPGAGFWSVVVGPDGTAYALALEPGSGEDTSATILTISPDGMVHYRATVVEP